MVTLVQKVLSTKHKLKQAFYFKVKIAKGHQSTELVIKTEITQKNTKKYPTTQKCMGEQCMKLDTIETNSLMDNRKKDDTKKSNQRIKY